MSFVFGAYGVGLLQRSEFGGHLWGDAPAGGGSAADRPQKKKVERKEKEQEEATEKTGVKAGAKTGEEKEEKKGQKAEKAEQVRASRH